MEKESVLSKISDKYLILLIFIMALAFRIYDLGGESIWYDEAISVAASKLGLIEQLKWIYAQNDNNPPLYYAIMHFWLPIFGDSEFSSRLPSAIFGSLSVVAIYAVGRVLFNIKTGLIAALILAASVFHIQYSQEARAYSLMVLLSLISLYYLLTLMRTGKQLHMLVYLLSTVLLIYTHYFAVLIVASQNIFYFTTFLSRRNVGEIRIKRWIYIQVILLVLSLPGLFLMGRNTLAIQTGFWIPEPTLEEVLRYFTVYSGSSYTLVILGVFSFLSLVGIGRIKGIKNSREIFAPLNDYSKELGISYRSRIYLLVLWLLVPIILPFILSLIFTPVLITRYTIGASVAFYLLASRGIVNTNNNRIIIVIACLILIFSFVRIAEYYERIDKYQWREAVGDIEAYAGYGDIVLVYPVYELQSVSHYAKRKDLKVHALSNEFLSFSGLGDRSVWVVLTDSPRVDKKRIRNGLSTKYDFISEKKYNKIEVDRIREKRR